MNVSGYPNLHFILGPNSGPGHNSALVYMESQIDYAVQGVRAVRDGGLRTLDVKPDVQRRYNEQLQERLSKTNWSSGCKSWYLTDSGYNATMYPGFATQYANELRHLDLADYRTQLRAAGERAPTAGAHRAKAILQGPRKNQTAC